MRYRCIITLGTAVALLNAACGRQNSSPAREAQRDQELPWLVDFDAAQTQARTQNKALLEVDFPHNKAQTDEQKAANEKLVDRYGIYGFPAEIVLDANGNKMGELGYMPGGPKPFIPAIEKLRQAAEAGAAER
jgi:hypothetical protein